VSSQARSIYAPFCVDVSVTLKPGICKGSPAAVHRTQAKKRSYSSLGLRSISSVKKTQIPIAPTHKNAGCWEREKVWALTKDGASTERPSLHRWESHAAEDILESVKPPAWNSRGLVDDEETSGGDCPLCLWIGKDARQDALLAHVAHRNAQK